MGVIRHYRPRGGTLDITDERLGRTIRCRDIQITYEKDELGVYQVSELAAMAVLLDGNGRPQRSAILRRPLYRAFLLNEKELHIPEIKGAIATNSPE